MRFLIDFTFKLAKVPLESMKKKACHGDVDDNGDDR